MARRSARLDARVNAAALAATQLVQNEIQAIEKPQGSRNLKRRKTSHEKNASGDNAVAPKSNRRGIRRRKGDSPFSKDVPLDILIEIFSLLEPIDLLYLSRTSKSLHGLLLSNDMVFLWKLVYENLSEDYRPPCPDVVDVVFYTNFLYGRHCQSCCSIYGGIYHDSALIRLCSKCADNGFLSVDGLDPSVSCLCNVSTVPKRKPASQVVLKVEYELRTKELNQARETNEVESYSRDRKVDVRNRALLSGGIGIWRAEMQYIRVLELKLTRTKRALTILEKLTEEGFLADFDLSCFDVYRVPHVRRNCELTDLEWSVIRADIVDYFQDFRDGEALYEMEDKLQTRVGLLELFIHQWKTRPTAWWIVVSSEPIASFIKSQIDEKISMDDFEKFKPQLHNLIASWKEETDSYLTSLIPDEGKQKNSRKHITSRLKLATTFFKCRHCEALISYPGILTHDCLIFGDDKSGTEEDEEDNKGGFKENVTVNARKPRGPREPRPPRLITADMVLSTLLNSQSLGMCAGREGVSFDEEAFNAAWDIITTCGEDPDTVTHDTMKKARLECMRCRRVRADEMTGSNRFAMKWPTALVHKLKKHKGDHTTLWRKVETRKQTKKTKKTV